MKYQRKQEVIEAEVCYRVGLENGEVKYVDAAEFERDFDPMPESSKKWIVVFRYGRMSNFKRSSNNGTRGVFATEQEAQQAAKTENEEMGDKYEYRAVSLDESV